MNYYCNICKKPISDRVFFYSKKKYGKALCMQHQKSSVPQKTKNEPKQKLNVVSGVQKIMKGVSQVIKEIPIKKETDFNKMTADWRSLKQLDFSLENKHFFLIGMDLDDFTKQIIRTAKNTILIANPYLDNCYLTDALMDSSQSSIKIKIVTRRPTSREDNKAECHSKLRKTNIFLRYNNHIHSKIIVVDEKITVVSSMNFYSGSSGGSSKEAGIVSIDEKVVKSASNYIRNLIDAP